MELIRRFGNFAISGLEISPFHYSNIPSGEKPRINIKNLHLMKERA